MVDDFSNHPVSLAERKAELDYANGGKLWTPRDALIKVLRDIDNGVLKPDVLIVCYMDQSTHKVGFQQASPSLYTTLGVVEACKELALKAGDNG